MSQRPCYECKFRRTEGYTVTVCALSPRHPAFGIRERVDRARGMDTCKPQPTLLIRLKELL